LAVPAFQAEQAPGNTKLGNCATVRKTGISAKGVLKAVKNVQDKIANAVCGMDALDQVAIDRAMIALDNSANKKDLALTRFLEFHWRLRTPPPLLNLTFRCSVTWVDQTPKCCRLL
jgi:hypothetical protein